MITPAPDRCLLRPELAPSLTFGAGSLTHLVSSLLRLYSLFLANQVVRGSFIELANPTIIALIAG